MYGELPPSMSFVNYRTFVKYKLSVFNREATAWTNIQIACIKFAKCQRQQATMLSM